MNGTIEIPNPHSWPFDHEVPKDAFVATTQNRHGELMVVVGRPDDQVLTLYHGDLEYEPRRVVECMVEDAIIDLVERNWLITVWIMWKAWKNQPI